MKEFIKTLSDAPPEGCDLRVGDKVAWENDCGVVFHNTVIRFNYDGWYQKKYKKYLHLDTESYWFPHDHAKITKI